LFFKLTFRDHIYWSFFKNYRDMSRRTLTQEKGVRMSLTRTSTVLVASLASFIATDLAAEDTFFESLRNGKADGLFRVRYEYVDQDGVENTAGALKAGVRLGYQTAAWKGLDFRVEFEGTADIAGEYGPKDANTPIIADPEVSDFNRVWARYSFEDVGFAKLGRQRVIYNNSRHIGNVGWRLNEQTYDGVRADAKFLEGKGSISVGGYWARLNILDTSYDWRGNFADIDLLAPVNLVYNFGPIAKVTAYGYYVDFDDSAGGRNDSDPANDPDNTTVGIRAEGAIPLGESMKFIYEGDLAQQNDAADREADFTAGYGHFVAGLNFTELGLVAKVGYEYIGTNDGRGGFAFPFGTNHKFSGWADKFLVSPAFGLTDAYGAVFYTPKAVKGLKAGLILHKFDSAVKSDDYGTEIDAVVTYKVDKDSSMGPGWLFGAKAAMYSQGDEDTPYTDTTKFWFWAQYKL
jgi:hypothetical protein